MAKTVVGLFDTVPQAQSVVQDLIDTGLSADNISLVANDAANSTEDAMAAGEPTVAEGAGAGAVGGTILGGTLGLLVGLGALAIPGIGPVVAAGPLLAALGATAAGAGIGAAAGGLLGALVGAGVPEEEANLFTEGVRRGGTLVTVSAEDNMADTVADIMNRHGVIDIDERSGTWGGDAPQTRPAYDTTDKTADDWEESSKVGTGTGTIAGAASGAALGSAGGPIGTVVGGIAGAVVGGGVGAAGDAAGRDAAEDRGTSLGDTDPNAAVDSDPRSDIGSAHRQAENAALEDDTITLPGSSDVGVRDTGAGAALSGDLSSTYGEQAAYTSGGSRVRVYDDSSSGMSTSTSNLGTTGGDTGYGNSIGDTPATPGSTGTYSDPDTLTTGSATYSDDATLTNSDPSYRDSGSLVGDETRSDWEESSKVGTGTGTVAGAATGAAIGSAGGPIGTVVGGIAGAVVGGGAGAAGDAAGRDAAENSDDTLYNDDTRVSSSGTTYRDDPTYNSDVTPSTAPIADTTDTTRDALYSSAGVSGDEARSDWEDSSKVGTGTGVVAGAATGAAIGSAGGPIGTVVGGIAGAVVGGGVGAAGDIAGEESEEGYNASGDAVTDDTTLAPLDDDSTTGTTSTSTGRKGQIDPT